MSLLQRFAAFAAALAESATDDVQRWQAKAHLLDTLGLCLAARRTEALARATAAAPAVPSEDAWTLGAAADALGLDDFDEDTRLHPGAVIVPALVGAVATAGADRSGGPVTGRQFLGGTVVGYEVLCRLGELLGSADMQPRGRHPSSVLGTPAAAAAIAAMMGDRADGIGAATGIGASLGAGLFQFDQQGLIRGLQIGWAAASAVAAFRLARRGYQPSPAVLDGRGGLVRAHGTRPAPPSAEELDAFLDARPRLPRVSFKPFTHFTDLHPLAKAVGDLGERSRLQADAIASVHISLPARSAGRLTERYPPTSVAEARRCPRFTVATVLRHHDPDRPNDPLLEAFSPAALDDPDLRELGRKVEWSARPPGDRPETVVEIRFLDGSRGHAAVEGYPGDGRRDDTRWGWTEVQSRFQVVVADAEVGGRADALVQVVRELEELEDVSTLLAAVRGAMTDPAAA